MTNHRREQIDLGKIIARVAQKEGVCENEVLDAMKDAMRAGFQNPDQDVQRCWQQIPTSGKVPTPEEVILWAVQKVLTQT